MARVRLWYSVRPIITLQGHITANNYVTILGDQVHPIVQTLFTTGDATYQDDIACVHTAHIVQDWFSEHEDEEECYKIPLQIIQDLYLFFPRRLQAVLQARNCPTPY
ncbi:hypothetical protein B7P43_G14268 [Cryptotermes secundus]|uniref:Uncharacterized protein n=1 Tax=Cryptotermes secundus TaxID=105785 RepID=A0A2J7RD60_9NEOP|nr:hypothetical protein B7P43_G14268 [Cryptotermes secundus]